MVNDAATSVLSLIKKAQEELKDNYLNEGISLLNPSTQLAKSVAG